ncbi:hypothetical protein BX070DRAFT_35645 [Coemansia spiralis]|nr:hypothetical protein BX070DRAFT_35645 [Coemansia spiralis]
MVAPPNGAYGVPVVAAPSHDAHMRAYHHPDTPGGLDAYGQNPFAFFKMPLGTQIHHPSAYKTHEKGSSQHAQGRHIGDTPPSSGSSQEAVRSHANGPQRQQTMPQDGGLGVTRERRTVPPAVSGLSLRINSDQKGDSDAPRSAPVDGPNQKRRISHDDVIMALRRKVMGKNGFQAQHHHSQQRQMPQLTPISVGPSSGGRQNSDDRSKMYRSSLSTISQVDSPDCIPEETSSSSSSSSSSAHADEADSALRSLASTATTENEDRRDSQQQRASSISHIVDSEPMPEAAKSVSSTS